MRNIELLSPARDVECGIAAINYGADAVYIGATAFGARQAATNPVADIQRLASYAHRFNARIYVTTNTIVSDSELEDVRRLIYQLYDAGVDALIVQDYALLQLDLPSIALHSSTQIDTHTPEKAKFLQSAGFSQIVVARELSLSEIKAISNAVSVPLEGFAHGALCVSYSGQCYLSQATTGRSANRGQCSQPCRLPYTLIDEDGNTILRDKYLLSLKDMNRSNRLEDMLRAGISSFKIEGRLKASDYVKNVTSLYRRKLDQAIEAIDGCTRSSFGKSYITFSPDLRKSFNRGGGTEYMLDGDNKDDIASPLTPKSTGEPVGYISSVNQNIIEIKGCNSKLNNGDGFCFFSPNGTLVGFRANRIEGNRIYISPTKELTSQLSSLGPAQNRTRLYRNNDVAFEHLLSQADSGLRKLDITITISQNNNDITFNASTEDSIKVSIQLPDTFEAANNIQKALDNLKTNISKTGNTIFHVTNVTVNLPVVKFIPNSIVTSVKNQLVGRLASAIESAYTRPARRQSDTKFTYPESVLDYHANIHNHLASEFLMNHGVTSTQPSFESKPVDDATLMTCRHCIKRMVGKCAKNDFKPNPQLQQFLPKSFSNPQLLISPNGTKLLLTFDCSRCEMNISKT